MAQRPPPSASPYYAGGGPTGGGAGGRPYAPPHYRSGPPPHHAYQPPLPHHLDTTAAPPGGYPPSHAPRHDASMLKVKNKAELHEIRRSLEKPNRLLFIRSISPLTTDIQLKELFSPYGEINELYRIGDKKGVAFVGYFDIRHAQDAKRELHGKEVDGRALDVHFALPKESKDGLIADPSTLYAFIRPPSHRDIPNTEWRNHFESYGPIRDVREMKGKPGRKFIEFFDVRDAEKALQELQGTEFNGGTLVLDIAKNVASDSLKSVIGRPLDGNAPPVAGEKRNYSRFAETSDHARRPPPTYRDRDQPIQDEFYSRPTFPRQSILPPPPVAAVGSMAKDSYGAGYPSPRDSKNAGYSPALDVGRDSARGYDKHGSYREDGYSSASYDNRSKYSGTSAGVSGYGGKDDMSYPPAANQRGYPPSDRYGSSSSASLAASATMSTSAAAPTSSGTSSSYYSTSGDDRYAKYEKYFDPEYKSSYYDRGGYGAYDKGYHEGEYGYRSATSTASSLAGRDRRDNIDDPYYSKPSSSYSHSDPRDSRLGYGDGGYDKSRGYEYSSQDDKNYGRYWNDAPPRDPRDPRNPRDPRQTSQAAPPLTGRNAESSYRAYDEPGSHGYRDPISASRDPRDPRKDYSYPPPTSQMTAPPSQYSATGYRERDHD